MKTDLPETLLIKAKCGERLRELREKKGITLQELSDNIGVSVKMLEKWESPNSDVRSNNIIKLAAYYGVTTDYILGSDDEEFMARINEIMNSRESNKS